MVDNNDLFCMLSMEDKLDKTTYPLWSYMMHHVLLVKGVWNIVASINVRPRSCARIENVVDEEIIFTTQV